MLTTNRRVNTDNYELKVRRLLRHSKHRKEVKSLKSGSFIFVPTDSIIRFPYPFKQNGKPFEFIPKPKPQPKPKTFKQRLFRRKPKRIRNLIETLKGLILYPFYLPKYKATYEKDKDESTELNAILAETEEQDEALFWD